MQDQNPHLWTLRYLVRSWRKTATVFPSSAVGLTTPGTSGTQGTFLANNFLDGQDIFSTWGQPHAEPEGAQEPKQFSLAGSTELRADIWIVVLSAFEDASRTAFE